MDRHSLTVSLNVIRPIVDTGIFFSNGGTCFRTFAHAEKSPSEDECDLSGAPDQHCAAEKSGEISLLSTAPDSPIAAPDLGTEAPKAACASTATAPVLTVLATLSFSLAQRDAVVDPGDLSYLKACCIWISFILASSRSPNS